MADSKPSDPTDGLPTALSRDLVGQLSPLFDFGRIGVVFVDFGQRTAHLSPALRDRLGLRPAQADGDLFGALRDHIHRGDLRAFSEAAEEAEVGAIVNLDFRVTGSDGKLLWWQIAGYRTPQNTFVALAIDITDRKRNERLLSLQRDGLDRLARGAQPADLIAQMVRAIEEVEPELKLFCFEPRREDPSTLLYVGGSTLGQEWRARLDSIAVPGGPGQADAGRAVDRALRDAGLAVERLDPVIDGQDSTVGIVAFARSADGSGQLGLHGQQLLPIVADVLLAAWEQWSKERRIIQLAYFDPLTGLGNRRSMDETVMRAIDADGVGQRFAIFAIDLDGFKPVNDVFGHDAGDMVLRELSRRMLAELPEAAELCRPGGDEFLVFLPVFTDEDAFDMAERIAAAIRVSIDIAGAPVSVSASIGVAFYPDDATGHSALFRAADLAMYEVKRLTKNGVRRYQSTLGDEAYRRYAFLSRLKQAFDRDELQLYFQPQVDVQTGRIAAAECLLRWRSEDGRLMSPGVDLKAFEASDIMTLVDRWVVAAACQHMLRWRRAGLDVVPLSLNLSPQRLRDDRFVEHLIGLVEEFGIPPEQLRIEVTEGDALNDSDALRSAIERLRDSGIAVYVDDFGSRFSHLLTLLKLPIDGLKIDRALVSGLGASARQRGIMASVKVLGSELGLDLVAEGVETLEDLAAIKHLGIPLVQGYLFSTPKDEAAFSAMLENADQYAASYAKFLQRAQPAPVSGPGL